MERREYTSVVASIVGQTKNAANGKRRGLRVVERLLLLVGILLLAVYVGAEFHRILMSRLAVRQFEAMKQSAPPAQTAAPQGSAESLPQVSPPSFSLWSDKRVKAYESSLDQQFAAPSAILRIPKIDLEVPVLEGTDDLTLNRGVGRIAGTSVVGQNGNIGIAGHRDGFFRGLKDIKVGDRIELEGRERTETYVVDDLQIVDPSNVSVLQARSKPSLTLVTCYPFYFIGSAPERFIVHASRTDSGSPQEYPTEQGSTHLAQLN